MVGVNGAQISTITFWKNYDFHQIVVAFSQNNYQPFLLYIIIFMLFFVLFFKNSLQFSKDKFMLKYSFYFSALFFIGVFSMVFGSYSEFIYFNF